MRIVIAIIGAVFCLESMAKNICVRNYVKEDRGFSMCDKDEKNYRRVEHLTDPQKEVCARMYAGFYCATSNEFVQVKDLDGNTICVMDYAQEPISNYCESVPEFYDYIVGEI